MSCQHCIIVLCCYSAKFVVVDNKLIQYRNCIARLTLLRWKSAYSGVGHSYTPHDVDFAPSYHFALHILRTARPCPNQKFAGKQISQPLSWDGPYIPYLVFGAVWGHKSPSGVTGRLLSPHFLFPILAAKSGQTVKAGISVPSTSQTKLTQHLSHTIKSTTSKECLNALVQIRWDNSVMNQWHVALRHIQVWHNAENMVCKLKQNVKHM